MNYYFVALLVFCTGYALLLGGAPERVGVSIYVVSCVTTHFALANHIGYRWLQVETGVLIVDFLTWLAFVYLTLRANRFWPIWASALLGLAVLGHLARWVAPAISGYAYAVVLSIWSYPILALFATATFAHHRRIKQSGFDKPWCA